MNFQNFETYEIHAEFCRAISNPKRLMIINVIGDKKITVGELAKALDLSVSNISQHLKVLKNYEVVKSEKAGHQVFYTLTDLRLLHTCKKIREIISDLYKKRKDVFNSDSS
ncbi:MAG: metalloregulator ArsR/SmtB family transcription factor [Acidobacteriota bacterium]